jgi:hypothetical protein
VKARIEQLAAEKCERGTLRADLTLTHLIAAKPAQAGVNITAHRHPAPGAPIQDRLRLPLRSHDFADVCERYLVELIQQSLRAASSSI